MFRRWMTRDGRTTEEEEEEEEEEEDVSGEYECMLEGTYADGFT